MVEGIGKTGVWNKRCEVIIEWERGQGIAPKKERDHTRNEGALRDRDGAFMGHAQRHHHALDSDEIRKEADRCVLKHYRRITKLDVIEKLGGVLGVDLLDIKILTRSKP
ncbi:hypothetical protein BGX21_008641 [Mortierella sp. AD011]|nr:hypothetical protein BGX21_008641 [Mortierella sp. AD011]